LEKFQKVENEWRKFKELLKKFDINKIISIHIDIVSRRYMCSTCENSYNYDLNKPDANLRKAMVRGILANLRYDVLKELIAKIDFTFLVSGSIPHSKDNRR
jgi:hypothetical protein